MGQLWQRQWPVQFPHGVAVDSSNNVYVADAYNNRVEKFDGNGNYLTQWGSYGSGNGQFDDPVGIASGQQQQCLCGRLHNNRVEKFDSNGNYLTQWGSYGSGNGQFSLPKVSRWTASNNRVEKFDSNGNYLTQWGSSGSGNGQFDSPAGIAVDSTGNLFMWLTYRTTGLRFSLIMPISSRPLSPASP